MLLYELYREAMTAASNNIAVYSQSSASNSTSSSSFNSTNSSSSSISNMASNGTSSGKLRRVLEVAEPDSLLRGPTRSLESVLPDAMVITFIASLGQAISATNSLLNVYLNVRANGLGLMSANPLVSLPYVL